MHAGEEGHARPGWTTSRRGQDSPWKSQSERQRTGINGESTSMVWPILGSRTDKEQNRCDARDEAYIESNGTQRATITGCHGAQRQALDGIGRAILYDRRVYGSSTKFVHSSCRFGHICKKCDAGPLEQPQQPQPQPQGDPVTSNRQHSAPQY